MEEAYVDFAQVYDELMDETPYELWCQNILNFIEKYGVSKPYKAAENAEDRIDSVEETVSKKEEKLLESERNLVLDLGCGTGTLTELLYKEGYDMIGVDNSESMLRIAMEKQEESGAQILYLLQDMRELALYSTVGTVISICDSLNYILSEEELYETFKLVDNYLYPGGIFIFDFNTDYKYREVIGDTTIAENREDCSFIWDNFYDEEQQINEYDLTVFVKTKEDYFTRFQETHFQRGYSADTMCSLVERAGMKIVEIVDADTMLPVTEESERIYIVAKEQTKELLQ